MFGSRFGRYSLLFLSVVVVASCDGLSLTGPLDAAALLGSAFSETGSALEARSQHIAVRLPGGGVLVAGGLDALGARGLRTAEIYDPGTGTWRAAASMTHERFGHAAVPLPDGRVLVAGGVTRGCALSPVSNSAEVYDPAADAWASAGDLGVARASPIAVALADGRVLLAGGGDRCGGVFRIAAIFDPATGRWSATGNMNVARQAAAGLRLPDGRVLVAGGVGGSPSFGALASAEIYDPATGAWTLTGAMSVARLSGSVDVSASDGLAPLPDGRVLAAGGFDSCFTGCPFVLHRSAEVFNPATGTWAAVGSMVRARSNHRLSVLSGGQVLVAGGLAAGVALSDAEVFDPTSGTFVAVGALGTARYDYTATRLGDGGVLFAQGHGLAGALSSAEIFGGNRAPLASAGAAVTGSEGSAVVFDGRGSSDPDGGALTYAWDFGDGSSGTGAMPSHVYADDGSYAVTLTVSDGALEATATTVAQIANVAPAVSGIAGAELLPGGSYAAAGSFTDPGADAWAATVDYGDGSGPHVLALAGKTFALGHVYEAAGTFTVIVTVRDDDGGAASSQATVLVRSLQEAIALIEQHIAEMQASGVLEPPTANSLKASLDAAIAKIDRGDYDGAESDLQVFITKVRGLIKTGRLSAEEGQPLIDEANRILRAIAGL